MDVHTIALWLIILRGVSVVFLSLTIARQIGLFNKYGFDAVWITRAILFAISISGLLLNVIPIMIDWYALSDLNVKGSPSAILTAYAFNNAVGAALLSVGWYLLFAYLDRFSKAAAKFNKK